MRYRVVCRIFSNVSATFHLAGALLMAKSDVMPNSLIIVIKRKSRPRCRISASSSTLQILLRRSNARAGDQPGRPAVALRVRPVLASFGGITARIGNLACPVFRSSFHRQRQFCQSAHQPRGHPIDGQQAINRSDWSVKSCTAESATGFASVGSAVVAVRLLMPSGYHLRMRRQSTPPVGMK